MSRQPSARFWSLIAILASFSSLPLAGASRLDYPRISFDDITGIAIVNPTRIDATVTLTGYRSDGQLIAAPGFTNPVQVVVPAGQQFARVVQEIFGGTLEPETVAWIAATSPVNDLTGFFLTLDAALTFFDGADLPERAESILFPEVCFRQDCSTELNLVNPGDEARTVALQINGIETPPIQIDLAPHGVTRFDARSLLPTAQSPAGAVPDSTYVTASSDGEILGFAFVQQKDGDLLGLNAKPGEELLNRIYFPQLAVLAPFQSQITIVNQGNLETLVTLRVFKPDGDLYGAADLTSNPVIRRLQPGERMSEDIQTLFGFRGSETLSGWMMAESTSQSVNGALTYALPSLQSVAAVSSQVQGLTSAAFSHIATTAGFFTGIAILNPGSLPANVRVLALRRNGTILGSYSTVVEPRRRVAELIQDIIPQAANQAGGFILVRSSIPTFLTSLFGSLESGVLANVPPQRIPETFRPDATVPQLRVNPPLAVVPPGSTQNFLVQGVAGEPSWLVNGVLGGNATVGMIDSSGQYAAPANMPATLPVTIAARLDDQLAAASVDVLTPRTLIQNLGSVQSVAYLSGLARLYTAELFVGPAPSQAGSGFSSRIRDVTPGRERTVLELPSENIGQIIPFRGIDGQEYLLLTAGVSGRILRLDPRNGSSTDVATDLSFPNGLVEDPSSGDVFVAAGNQVLRVSQANLNSGLMNTALGSGPTRLFPPTGVATAGSDLEGIAVNPCNGNIVVSDGELDELVEIDRASGLPRVLANRVLGHLLYVLRSGVPCPQGAQLLGVDFVQNGLFLYTETNGGEFIRWAQVSDHVTSLTGLPTPNTFELENSILISQEDFAGGGSILRVETPGIYDPVDLPINPPPIPQVSLTRNVYQFTGTVAEPEEPGPTGSGVEAGTPVSGGFYFDPSQAVLVTQQPDSATYDVAGSAGLELTLLGQTFSFREEETLIGVGNNLLLEGEIEGDLFILGSGFGGVFIVDSSGTLFDSTAIPTFLGNFPSPSLSGGVSVGVMLDGVPVQVEIHFDTLMRIH